MKPIDCSEHKLEVELLVTLPLVFSPQIILCLVSGNLVPKFKFPD